MGAPALPVIAGAMLDGAGALRPAMASLETSTKVELLQLAAVGVPESQKCALITCPYHQHRLGLPGHEGASSALTSSSTDVREEVSAMAQAALRAASTSRDAGKPRASWSPLAQRYMTSPPSAAVVKAKPRLGIVRTHRACVTPGILARRLVSRS